MKTLIETPPVKFVEKISRIKFPRDHWENYVSHHLRHSLGRAIEGYLVWSPSPYRLRQEHFYFLVASL